MNIKTLEVDGIGPAIHAMRNPMDSWSKSDTIRGMIGPKDRELSERLAKAGSEHAKHLRFIQVWAEVIGPRYWLTELDTYRMGVEKLSCSTMHKLMARPLTLEDFEHERGAEDLLTNIIISLNGRMENYKALLEAKQNDEAKQVWREIIQLLPQSYLQRRTFMFSYAALRNIIKQRTGHKLKEWAFFIDWCRTLPESWMLFDGDEFNIG